MKKMINPIILMLIVVIVLVFLIGIFIEVEEPVKEKQKSTFKVYEEYSNPGHKELEDIQK